MDIIRDTLSSDKMWGAIIASIVIIGLGYCLVKVKILKMEWKAALNTIVLKVALPVLAIKGFAKSITTGEVKEQGFILGFSFVFYLFLLVISKYLFAWVKERNTGEKMSEAERSQFADKTLMRMMWVFGSTTFFGFPIVEAVYGSKSMLSSNMFNIGYRVFIYSVAFSQMSGIKFTKATFKDSMVKVFKNPIIIATFLGLGLWLLQLATPNVTYKGNTTTFFNLSKTAPWMYKTITVIAGLCSPLVWLSIGMTLAASSIREAAKDKKAWGYVALKQLLLPAMGLGILLAFSQIDSLNISKTTVCAITVLLATPPATVVIAYAMQFKKSEDLASRTSVISTLAAVVAMPIWIVTANALSVAIGLV